MFEVGKKPIKTLFNETRSFIIPDFQRGFAWGTEEVDEFYDDLKNENLFFIGSFILKVNPESRTEKVEIIDGQQRTITLSLFYAALGSLLDGLVESENSDDAKINAYELRKSIAEVDKARPTNISKFKVDFQDDYTNKFFAMLLSGKKPDDLPSDKDLFKKVKKIYSKIIELIEKDTNLNYEELIKLKEKIEDTEIIVISIQKDELAYQIFETVNARGVDLTVAELLKNHLFKTIQDHKLLKEKWTDITDNLKQTQIKQLDLSTSLRFYWISNFEHITKRRLYRAIKNKISEGGITEKNLLDEIYSFSIDLGRIYDNDQNKWVALFGETTSKRRQAARWFFYKNDSTRVFSKSIQYLPVFTAILKQRKRIDIASSAFRKLIHAIESINFIYLEMLNLPGNMLEKKYSEYSRKISQSKEKDEITRHITKLYQELIDIIKERTNKEDVYKYVKNLSYSSKKDYSIIMFIFSRLELLKSDFGIVINPTNVSAEHIYSQSGIGTSNNDIDEKMAHSIGNLTIMEFSGPSGNGGLNDNSFQDKKETYAKSPYSMTRNLCAYSKWTSQEINNRTNEFSQLVWKIWGPEQELKDLELN